MHVGGKRARLSVPPYTRTHHHSPPHGHGGISLRFSACPRAPPPLERCSRCFSCMHAHADRTAPTALRRHPHPALAAASLTARVHSQHPPQVDHCHTNHSAGRTMASRSGRVTAADGRHSAPRVGLGAHACWQADPVADEARQSRGWELRYEGCQNWQPVGRYGIAARSRAS